ALPVPVAPAWWRGGECARWRHRPAGAGAPSPRAAADRLTHARAKATDPRRYGERRRGYHHRHACTAGGRRRNPAAGVGRYRRTAPIWRDSAGEAATEV